jgi:Holliday junction resolvase RusA-like endonuclease
MGGSPQSLNFRVTGEPIPQGSMKAFVVMSKGKPRAVLTSDNPRTKPWKRDVAAAAEQAMKDAGIDLDADAALFDEAVMVKLTFWLTRPKSAQRRLWPSTKKADLDKLVRAALDALTNSRVIQDDALVVALSSVKLYATDGMEPGARISVSQVMVSTQDELEMELAA